MKVSVIVPAYEAEKYIVRCLSSLVNQTLKEIEIIVVNDGSLDNTLYLCEQVAKYYSNITVISQENKGPNEARKNGLDNARGEYILFVDSDDWLEPNALTVLYDEAVSTNADMVLFHAIITDGETGSYFKTYTDEIKNEKTDYLEGFLRGQILPAIWAKFLKREFIQKKGINFPSNISYAEDVETAMLLLSNEPHFKCCESYLYYYFQNPKSLTTIVSPKFIQMIESFYYITNLLESNGLLEKYSTYLLDFSNRHMGYVVDLVREKDNILLQHLISEYQKWYLYLQLKIKNECD